MFLLSSTGAPRPAGEAPDRALGLASSPEHNRAVGGASLAHSGRTDEAARIVEAALQRRPGATLDTVASSLDGFDRPRNMRTVLEGLRLAGLPG